MMLDFMPSFVVVVVIVISCEILSFCKIERAAAKLQLIQLNYAIYLMLGKLRQQDNNIWTWEK